MKYVIDAWAWIEYLIGSNYGVEISKIIEDESNEIFTCSLTVAEVISMIKRENKDFDSAYEFILSHSKFYNINPKFAKESALMHADIKKDMKDFGLADSFVLATAKMLNAKIVTGDPHFKKFKNVVFIS